MTNTDLLPEVRAAIYSSETIISDQQLLTYIDNYIQVIGSDDDKRCLVLYNSILQALQYLAMKWNIDAANATGGALSRSEKVGGVQVDVDYGDSLYGSNPYQPIYDKYLNGELALLGCPILSTATKKLLIGGVSEREINRVNRNPDSVNGRGNVASTDRRTSKHHTFWR